MYDWVKDGFKIQGIGIRRDYFDVDTLIINLKGNKYSLDTKLAIEFAKKYNSYFNARNNVVLLVVSLTLLKPIIKN
jgi:hypothetical protein